MSEKQKINYKGKSYTHRELKNMMIEVGAPPTSEFPPNTPNLAPYAVPTKSNKEEQ